MVNKELLLPFLLISFLFIVVLTIVLYKIMWMRLDAMIKKNKEDEERTGKSVLEQKTEEKE
ncbi:hypothetical protein HMPREF9624_00481 [Oribacterium asaccharolyticum ACB7]|jgi:hypothetical protein|uniref:Uncharacterized protein n=1 Tax=Oribacterium asaccharolyticum ACB7 TaxID=796944 RepID=G9WTX1_9FIRM|nr:hypothetical protein [Oribacterium asaccharolyticum]EHL12174.1 hypothetical protein HMPREF9624_00481 [Oribacterium asaccharolyticum ACB7]